MFITSVRESRQETQTRVSALLPSLSADDEDSRSLLSHWRKTLYHHVVHQTVFILFFIPPSSISFCSCIGWDLRREPLPLHRLSQLTGQLLHRHLKDVKAGLNLVSHLFVALKSVAITGFHYSFLNISHEDTLMWRGGTTNLQLFEEVEHGHAHHNDQEGSQRRYHVHRLHAPPLLEEDDGGGQNHGGEEDVVDGVDQQGVEGVQRLVEVVHLWAAERHFCLWVSETVSILPQYRYTGFIWAFSRSLTVSRHTPFIKAYSKKVIQWLFLEKGVIFNYYYGFSTIFCY